MEVRMHCEATYMGLHNWTHAMFEKLGWMVLAKAYGQDFKVNAYKKSLNYLLKSIDGKIKKTHDPDKIADLQVLQKNVKVLQAHVSKDFK